MGVLPAIFFHQQERHHAVVLMTEPSGSPGGSCLPVVGAQCHDPGTLSSTITPGVTRGLFSPDERQYMCLSLESWVTSGHCSWLNIL